MELNIRVTSGPHDGKQCAVLHAETFSVGRSSQSLLSLPDDRLMSREHFQVEFDPPLCHVKDLGSTNGTFVNDRRVDRVRLRDGDAISAGQSTFLVRLKMASSDGESSLECPGCGKRFSGDLSATMRPGEEAYALLCDQCNQRRLKFPTTAPDYLIEKRIGVGGMGEVYLARQLSTHQPVAIKMITTSETAQEGAKNYFGREVRILRDLLMPSGGGHPNIVAFYDLFTYGGQFQLVMEYVPGKNALEWMNGLSAPLSVASVARIGFQLLSALHYAHGKGYVHRDVKPSNLLIMGPAHRPRVKLSDFGLAKNMQTNALYPTLTHLGDVGGSVGFISPDHIRSFHEAKEPADIYSVGTTLYYLLTKRYPFLGFDPHRYDAYTMILEHPPVPLRAHRPDTPEGFDRAIRKALEKNPDDRWKSAGEMAAAMRPYMDQTASAETGPV